MDKVFIYKILQKILYYYTWHMSSPRNKLLHPTKYLCSLISLKKCITAPYNLLVARSLTWVPIDLYRTLLSLFMPTCCFQGRIMPYYGAALRAIRWHTEFLWHKSLKLKPESPRHYSTNPFMFNLLNSMQITNARNIVPNQINTWCIVMQTVFFPSSEHLKQ